MQTNNYEFMNFLPFKLNFFKQAEQFWKLRKYDKQYNRMVDEKLDTAKETLPEINGGDVPNITWPSWNVEKKILMWTYLGHKHLGTSISEEYLANENFRKATGSTQTEIGFIGPKYILENLIVKGFANGDVIRESQTGCIINQNGLSTGEYLAHNYKEKLRVIDNLKITELVPKKTKILGHYLLYFSALLMILYSITLLCLNVLNSLKLLDVLSNFINEIIPYNWVIILIILLPVILFILSFILISFTIFSLKGDDMINNNNTTMPNQMDLERFKEYSKLL